MQGNKKLNEKRIHPTQKPIVIYKYLLRELGVKRGHVVMDSHRGSDSLAIACYEMGIDMLGYEIKEEIHLRGVDRFTMATRQARLPIFC